MKDFLMLFLKCSVTMSVISALYMLLTPIISKRYSAKWRYAVWIVITVCWLIPFRPLITLPAMPMMSVELSSVLTIPQKLPVPAAQTEEPDNFTFSDDSEYNAEETLIRNMPKQIDVWHIAIAIWLVGVLGFVTYHGIKHNNFRDAVRRWGEQVTDISVNNLFISLKDELKIKRGVRLKVCPYINSPMLFGIIAPVILLPCIDIPNDKLAFIMHHELIHLKRHDLVFKLLSFFALSIHWFNPVAHLMANAASTQCELACDEAVLSESDTKQRRQYGEIIIGIALNGGKVQTILTTNFYERKKEMKNRISSIMDMKKKKIGVIMLCAVLVATFSTGISFAALSNEDILETVGNAASENIVATELIKEITELFWDCGIIELSDISENGNLIKYESNITRKEMAMFIAKIHTENIEAVNAPPSRSTPFKDVTDPAYFTAINYCADLEIIKPKAPENNLYCPEAAVTVQEAAEIIVCAIGYTGFSSKDGYIMKANELGLFEGFTENFKDDLSHELTREETIIFLYNFFYSEYVEVIPVLNSWGRYEMELKYTPVCAKFGIEPKK